MGMGHIPHSITRQKHQKNWRERLKPYSLMYDRLVRRKRRKGKREKGRKGREKKLVLARVGSPPFAYKIPRFVAKEREEK